MRYNFSYDLDSVDTAAIHQNKVVTNPKKENIGGVGPYDHGTDEEPSVSTEGWTM